MRCKLQEILKALGYLTTETTDIKLGSLELAFGSKLRRGSIWRKSRNASLQHSYFSFYVFNIHCFILTSILSLVIHIFILLALMFIRFSNICENKWDLFSQNEWQVARELLEIWLTEHFKRMIENKGISQGNNCFWTPNKTATLACYISF